jgi:hypothetical protein
MVDHSPDGVVELEFVVHGKKPEWGIGRVLQHHESTNRIHVFFEHHGRKVLRADMGLLESVEGDRIGPNSVLRHLNEAAITGTLRSAPRPFDDLLQTFKAKFPTAFDDPAFSEGERAYKEEARALASEQLAPDHLQAMLDEGDFGQMFKNLRKVVSKTNQAFHIDQSKLGGIPSDCHEVFCRSLFDLLHGDDAFGDRFARFIAIIEPHGAAKWPVVTYFPFILTPEAHYLVKPNVLRPAAQMLAFDLHYVQRPNPDTYEQVLRFCAYVKEQLEAADLHPRDMVDLQTFFWFATGAANKHARS